MTLSSAQWRVLRAGSVFVLLAGLVVGAIAFTIDPSDDSGSDVTVVEDAQTITLPDKPLFGGSVMVYGVADQAGVDAQELGCRLVSESGGDQGTARLSDLRVVTESSITAEGTELQPLFEVTDYPDGAAVACDQASSVMPMAVSQPSTFGTLAGSVKGFAFGVSALCLIVGALGWVFLRPRR